MKKLVLSLIISSQAFLASAAMADVMTDRDLTTASRKIENVLRYVNDRGLRQELIDAQSLIREVQYRLNNRPVENFTVTKTVQYAEYMCGVNYKDLHMIKPTVDAIYVELKKRCGSHCEVSFEYQKRPGACDITGTAFVPRR